MTWNAALVTLWKNIESSTHMFKSPSQQQMLRSSYWKRCVKSPLLFWNNKPERVYATPIATQLHLLSPEDGASLLSNNFDAERHLVVFVKRAPVAKFCNKKLTLKKSEMTLLYSSQQHSRIKGSLLLSASQWHGEGLGQRTKAIPTTEDSGEDWKRKDPVNVYAKILVAV